MNNKISKSSEHSRTKNKLKLFPIHSRSHHNLCNSHKRWGCPGSIVRRFQYNLQNCIPLPSELETEFSLQKWIMSYTRVNNVTRMHEFTWLCSTKHCPKASVMNRACAECGYSSESIELERSQISSRSPDLIQISSRSPDPIQISRSQSRSSERLEHVIVSLSSLRYARLRYARSELDLKIYARSA